MIRTNVRKSDTPGSSRHASRRARDMGTVTVLSVAVLCLLALSGALGWVEAITAAIVLAAATMAYYVGSTATPTALAALDEDVRGQAGPAESALPRLLDALPVPALHIGPDSRIRAANPPAQALFRIRPEQRSLAAAAIREPALLAGLDLALGDSASAQRVEVTLGSGGDELWLAHIAPFQTSEGGAMIILEDRTALRRSEKARADFLANASHELRTPLTSLAGFIETMRGPARNDPESWARYLDIMFTQTERMKRLIADLLSLSRIEFSEHKPPQTVEDIADLLGLSVAALRPVAADRGIRLEVHGPERGLKAVADADEVTQVVANLVANAVKYSPQGSKVRIHIGAEASHDGAQRKAGRQWPDVGRIMVLPGNHRHTGPAIWVRVEDEGPGIDRQHLPRLGQRFYRVDESRGGEVTGTGLGLAIVKHVMTRHRGGFLIESEPGRGSAFGVWFPAIGPVRPAISEAAPADALQSPVDPLANRVS